MTAWTGARHEDRGLRPTRRSRHRTAVIIADLTADGRGSVSSAPVGLQEA
jgi:hypothetical protein